MSIKFLQISTLKKNSKFFTCKPLIKIKTSFVLWYQVYILIPKEKKQGHRK